MSNSTSLLELDFMKVLLRKAKAMYTIVDKISGEVVGHALMLTEDNVLPEHLLLQPLQEHGKSRGDEHPEQPVGEIVSDWSEGLAPATLASDLDISEDSSVNITEEDGNGVLTCHNNVKRENRESSDSFNLEDMNKNISSEAVSNEKDNDIQIISEICKKPTSLVSVPSCSGSSPRSSETETISTEVVKCEVNDTSTSEINIEDRNKHKADNDISLEAKEAQIKSAVSNSGKLLPGSLSVFYTDVGVMQPKVPKYKGHKLVRCLLCKEEKILAASNFGDHLLGVHEQPVQCDVCGKEFSAQWIRKHRKVCHAIKERGEVPPIVDKSRSGKKVKTGDKIRLKLISAVDPEKRLKILLKKDSKINKVKKKFGKRYNVSSKKLKLVHCGVELTGDELACQVEGEEIIVHEGF